MENKKCSLCEQKIYDWGHNSHITGKRICEYCNSTVELPARISKITSGSMRKFLNKFAKKQHVESWYSTKITKQVIKNIKNGIKEIDEIRKGDTSW